MEYLDEISSLRRASGIDELRYMVDDPGGIGLAERVIDQLPEDRELTFYDESGYNPRDFGANVVVRAYDGKYYYQLVPVLKAPILRSIHDSV